MSFFQILIMGFLYFIFCYFVTLKIYNALLPFYSPCLYKKSNNVVIDIHKRFRVFHPEDKIDFNSMLFGCLLFFPVKGLMSVVYSLCLAFHLRILEAIYSNTDTDERIWLKSKRAIRFWSTIFLRTNGIRILEKKVNCESVYRKYLGDDYDFTDQKYSLIISNHTGFFDVMVIMKLYSPGFIAKLDVASLPFVGRVAKALHCLFLNRGNKNERKKIFEQLERRQKNFYEGKSFAPLALFPEGTTTCGRNILKFKKGSFYALLPVKPNIVNIYPESDNHLTAGALSVELTWFKHCTRSVECFYHIDMPVIRPTEFMFKNYSHFGREKWEIYAEVCRKIMAEIGGLEESNLGYRDELKYVKAVKKGIFDEIEDENNSRISSDSDYVVNENTTMLSSDTLNNDNNKDKNEKVKEE